MIGRLSGILLDKQAPHLLLDVQGVGYEIQAPMTTFYQLPEIGLPVTLLTHFVVREDAQQLYGFHNLQERTLFRDLIKINGVGPKLALTILSGIEALEFIYCVRSNNAEQLVRLPGVGKKTAERLIIEMRDKLKAWDENISEHPDLAIEQPKDIVGEAESALVALGYKSQEANKIVSKLNNGKMTSEELIREALKNMVQA